MTVEEMHNELDEPWYECGLTSIICEVTTPPLLDDIDVFTGTLICPIICPIYVQSGSVDTYKATSGWSTYADRIYAIS